MKATPAPLLLASLVVCVFPVAGGEKGTSAGGEKGGGEKGTS
jgi:hypothetical protein